MKPLVIYHANCADGFSAAWVFHNLKNKTDEEFEFYPGVYSKPAPDCTDEIVYLVDFSYKKDVVIEICKVAKHVVLIDHHKTAIDDLRCLQDFDHIDFQNNFSWYVDLERSGAMLAWDYFHNADKSKPGDIAYMYPPKLLEYVQDRDLWKFKLDRTREISAAVASHEYTFENWDTLMGSDVTALLNLSHAGAAIERKHQKDVADLIRSCMYMGVIGDSVVPMASLPYIFSSDAAHAMAVAYENGNYFAACYWDTPTGRTFSLRSTDWGMDVSLIAAHYGGGGHKHAAGFSVPKDHRLANRTKDEDAVQEAIKARRVIKTGAGNDF